jgi:dihydropteroate synthase
MELFPALSQLLQAPGPWLMGILNITPDSFSDGGAFIEPNAALQQAHAMHAAGAHVIDIGGESSRPGSQPITATEEQARILPVLQVLPRRYCISVDTYKAETAALALEHGASIINDISALRYDPDMAALIAKKSAFVVLMYSKESATCPHASLTERHYTHLIHEIKGFFEERLEYALSKGIERSRIILDPGMGRFLSHDPKYSWELLRCLHELSSFGLPLLVGVSRKGFLGASKEQLDNISAVVGNYALSRGACMLRTHDVAITRQFIGHYGLS